MQIVTLLAILLIFYSTLERRLDVIHRTIGVPQHQTVKKTHAAITIYIKETHKSHRDDSYTKHVER